MVSFMKLWENIEKFKEESDTDAMQAIRTGLNIRDDFWDDFLSVINNSEALSGLLDVPTTKISSWHSKITDALSQVKHSDETPEVGKNTKMLPTGDNAIDLDPELKIPNNEG